MAFGIFCIGRQTRVQPLRTLRPQCGLKSHLFPLRRLANPILHISTEFIHHRTVLLVYWSNILLLGLTLFWSWIPNSAGDSSPANRQKTEFTTPSIRFPVSSE
jgi:hypothetical protein